ncbi:MAG: UDP-N-acetylmuramoyl-tripeptide--D-alanyl-D-alanine ligase [Acidimicrobiaceae bacterium]|nr:UDP-N-acetylmuramoyl-tripeptide--D-alanyl-D-alanine ligase [Acidimicrobiaceae bacterium]
MTAAGATLLVALAATAAGGLRWLRVAQREHYLAGSTSRFAWRWWSLGPNVILLLAWVLGVGLAATGRPLPGLFGAAAVGVGPFGLGLKGRTSPLAWTRRLKTLAGVWAALHVVLVLVGLAASPTVAATAAALGAGLVPVLVDAALAITAPVERRMGEPWVDKAKARLAQVRPTVVAITGSYGKTSTKGYLAHLIEGTKQVVPTPRSFNNRAGLARAVNEALVPGTEVFIAEMGTYGKGEIAEMCSWCPPDVAVITAIGPVHLERMHSEDVITEAKAEILERARVAVLNTDNPHLAALADRTTARAGVHVRRCSAVDLSADVAVIDGRVHISGRPIGTVDAALPSTNVACAVAAALEVGVPEHAIADRLAGLQPADHRLTITTGGGGFAIIDDTYNANPAGAQAALAALASQPAPATRAEGANGAKRVVVTPGMVELGSRQAAANAEFAAEASRQATHVVVVGQTNRRALLEGAASGPAAVVTVDTRDQAVEWVRANLGPGDVVLYENDLPDHFP